MDRGTWWATVHGIAEELDTTKQLDNNDLPQYLAQSMCSVNGPGPKGQRGGVGQGLASAVSKAWFLSLPCHFLAV